MRRPPAVARVLERVTKTIRRNRMLRDGEVVLACVSGGPDSVCLAESLVRLRKLFKIRVEVLHVDHGLRADSGVDAQYVRRLAARLGLPFHMSELSGSPPKGASLEAWATNGRTRAANEVAKEISADAIAEGHTMNDQAETVLLALVRGGGIEAMAGIRPVMSSAGSPQIVQPLLDVKRSEVEAFCRALGLHPMNDETNLDTSLLRNALRLEVIPAIEDATGRSVIEPIARSADLLASYAAELRDLEAPIEIARGDGGDVRIRAQDLKELPDVIASRLVRRLAYDQLPDDGSPWSKEAIDSVVRLAAARPGSRVTLPAGSTAWRSREYVHMARAFPEG